MWRPNTAQPEEHNPIGIIVLVAVTIVGLLIAAECANDCESRGGKLVEGPWNYYCVQALPRER
jgi:hypothetical protein